MQLRGEGGKLGWGPKIIAHGCQKPKKGGDHEEGKRRWGGTKDECIGRILKDNRESPCHLITTKLFKEGMVIN